MKEAWISKRRTLQLSGLTIDHHVSEPNELDFPGCNDHLLCLLLSDSNQQKMTRIGEQESEKSQIKGDFWICPAQISGLWAWDSTDESLMFVIDPLLLSRTAEEVSGLDASHVELLSTIGARNPHIQAIAHLFQAELDTGGIGGSLYSESLMQVLIIHLLRQYCTLQPKIQDITESLPIHRLQSVLDYIHSYLDRPLHLAELAAVAGMSQYHFCRVFKQSIGIAPYQYVLQQRMEKAKELLHQGKHKIAEISLLVGCNDQSRFAKQFKKHFGVTPGLLLGKKLP
ncbi:helix-turn-helix transcriptional regulator [Scytonema hofmannii FACHB-248]|uniref:Helix-turn-helix transcriptional regulator n=1 Tax=Scytonema hofmannii FACHB-248 TaxID=1842502 RepID=A0ABR8GP26_9CYAN|nr:MULTISPECIES: AraC family transcriptional regulator [Nostocales]MBD2605179.1 helix-turn-helix transcriptional regulator [Scytonema hofmannii FACHB-248]